MGSFGIFLSAILLTATSARETSATITFTKINVDKSSIKTALNGQTYCRTTLYNRNDALSDYFDYVPCAMIDTILQAHGYSKLSEEQEMIPLGSDKLKLEGSNLYSAFSNELKRLNDSLANSFLPWAADALSQMKCPKISDDEIDSVGDLANWGFMMAFNEPDNSQYGINAWVNTLKETVAARTKDNPVKIESADQSEFTHVPKCFAKFLKAERGTQKLLFSICASSQLIECEQK